MNLHLIFGLILSGAIGLFLGLIGGGGSIITVPVLVYIIIGVLTGFLGVGGGFLIVPALVFFGGLSMREAIGTSLLIIAINCGAGLVGHLRYGGFDVHLRLLVTALAIVGAFVGAALSHKASSRNLRRWFALLVIAVAVFLVAKNYAVLL